MKKIIISTIAAASLSLASNYEITPMVGYVDTKEHITIKDQKVGGVSISRNMDDDCKLDQVELGLLQTLKTTNYRDITEDTALTRLFVNGVKEYKLNDKFNLYALAGLGYEYIDNEKFRNDSDTFFNYGAGIKYALTDSLSIKLDARHLLKFDGDKNVLYTLGVAIPFGEESTKNKPKDNQDSDLQNSNNVEEITSEDVTTQNVEESNSNSEQVVELDNDNDGVVDSKDSCLSTQAGVTVDENGCEVLEKPQSLEIVFQTNSDIIKTTDLVKFDKYVDYLNRVSDAKVVLEAHTDSRGEAEYNLLLSQKRAYSVKLQLVNMGIDKNRIETIGYGETQPLVSNDTEENRQINRRVTAKITK